MALGEGDPCPIRDAHEGVKPKAHIVMHASLVSSSSPWPSLATPRCGLTWLELAIPVPVVVRRG
jgi:hypothetical protein